MKSAKWPLCLLVIVCLSATLTAFAMAKTQSFTMDAGKEFTLATPNLVAGDRFSVTLTVVGPVPNTLHFSIVLANGTAIDYGGISQRSIDLFADADGPFQLHFDNSNSADSQTVTLNYEIEHFVFGIPNMIFMLIVITVLLVFVAAGYVIMGKYG